jgi:ring-1,2-phenylacetyl-CoA epoxidase subunit PaaD
VVTCSADVLAELRSVEDPELPVSIVDLGMVKEVVETDGRTVVTLVPTFLGCPAQMFIEHDVIEAVSRVRASDVEVRWSSDDWSLDDVTPLARERLREFGVAMPDDEGHLACPHCGSHQLRIESDWGSTLCRKTAYCPTCQTPVEVMKAPMAKPVVVRLARHDR